MEFPDSYFEDEVRDGFLVPGMMKRSWAVQLEILEDVKKVCEKHGISYFADWGSILGAIRHGGFIPWDDDLDICMKRADYEKFVEVAAKDLPEGYSIMSYRTTDTTNMVTKILNYPITLISQEDLPRWHGYPYPEVIDLFVVDFLPRDPETKEALQELLSLISILVYHAEKDDMDSESIQVALEGVEKICDIKFDREKPLHRQLLRALEKVAAGLREEDADELIDLSYYLESTDRRILKSFYEKTVNVPFENTEIAVPAAYGAVLSYEFGTEWLKRIRTWDSHGYPSYKSVQETVKNSMKIEPLRYKYSKEEIEEAEAKRIPKETLQKKVMDFLPLFREAHEEIRRMAGEGEWEAVSGLLGECQNVAIQLGTMVEEESGEGHPTVRILEAYCETIFRLHQGMAEATDSAAFEELSVFEKRLEESAGQDLKARKEAVFIPYKVSYWGAMESVWKTAVEDGETDVYVIPAPYYYKDDYGKAKKDEPHYETEYPEDVAITSYENYNFETRHPDVVVIQCPYDEYHYGLMIHPFFFAKNLKQYTEKLVYIPPLVMDEIVPEDERGRTILRDFCNMPGVAHADLVTVQSEQMKDVYVELLTEFAGDETKAMWEEKIQGLGSPVYDAAGLKDPVCRNRGVPEKWLQMTKRADGNRKKVVFYSVNAGVLFDLGSEAVEKMEEAFRLFREQQEEIVLLWRPDPAVRELLRKTKPDAWQKYRDLLQEYREADWGIYDDSGDLERAVRFCDAFYGYGEKAANMCQDQGKPVMLRNVTVKDDE